MICRYGTGKPVPSKVPVPAKNAGTGTALVPVPVKNAGTGPFLVPVPVAGTRPSTGTGTGKFF